MIQALIPAITHLFYHLEPLLEVQALGNAGDINALVKMIGIFSIDGRGNVPGGIQSAAVGFQDQAGRHAFLFQIHHHSSFAFLQKIFFLQFLNHRLHLVIIKGLTGIGVKFDPQQIINFFIFLHADVNEPAPKGTGFFISLLQACKPFPRFLIQGRILFRFLMEFNI